ncbi:MAG: TonB-dependent receptor [Prevotella sp.]|nr:TonB-dependent receptor [Prevotella sp.]
MVLRSYHWMRTILFLTLACILPCNALAQPMTDSITGKTHSLTGIDVVTSYNRNVHAATPQQEINSGRMLTMGIESLSDVLKNMAGVTLRDYGGAGGMKTLSVRGIGSRHTQVIYDGFPMSNCQTGEIDLSRYSLNYTDRISLTMGDGDQLFLPARSMLGAATLTVESRGSRVESQGSRVEGIESRVNTQPQLSVGSWGTVNPALFYSQQLSQRVTVTAIGEYFYADNDYPFTLRNGTITSHEHRVNSRMSSGHGEANVFWKVSRISQLQAKTYYYDNSRKLPGIVRYYTQENDERLHERNAFTQLHYINRITDKWHLQAHAKWDWADSDYENNNPGSVATSAHYKQQEAYTSVSTLYDATSWLSTSVAADYIYNHLQNTAAALHGPDRHSLLQAVAAQVHIQRLTATAKLLAMEVSDKVTNQPLRHTNRLLPSMSASYQLLPSEQLYVRVMWKQGLRMPSFNELYYFHFGTTELQPERANQWNAGITWQSRNYRRFQTAFTVDGFVTDVKDKIVAIPFNMFVWRMMNLARVRTTGVDITTNINYHLNKKHSFELTGSYSLQRAENRTDHSSPHYGKQIAYIPQSTWSIAIGWQNPYINVSVTNSGMSERWATNEHYDDTRMGGFAETSISLWRGFDIRKIHCILRASVLNVFDRQYELVANYPMPGRSWKITAQIEL